MAGLQASSVVVAFVSDNYASSDNCRMEFQFAVKSLRKPIIPGVRLFALLDLSSRLAFGCLYPLCEFCAVQNRQVG